MTSIKKPSRTLNPDLILVSDHYTNGLFHHERDIGIIANVLMEHTFMSCFTCETLKEETPYTEFVGDFAMYRIDTTVNNEGTIQFKKRQYIIGSQELFEFVRLTREDVNFPTIANISLLENEVNTLHDEILAGLVKLKEKLVKFLDITFNQTYSE